MVAGISTRKAMKNLVTLVAVLVSMAAPAKEITQHKWSTYEWVDTCTSQYAVVHDWLGRCGIYDLEKGMNITELEFRNLQFIRTVDCDDGSQFAMFMGHKGHRMGVVTVNHSGEIFSILMTDEDMEYTLDSCRTIDGKVSRLARRLLEKDMKAAGGTYGQAFVMESQTGNILTWVALEDELRRGKYSDAPLLKKQLCSDHMKPLYAITSMVESGTSWNDSVDTGCGTDTIGDLVVMDSCPDNGGYGKVSYLDGFKMHSNIAMVRAMEKTEPFSLTPRWLEVANSPRSTDALAVAEIYNVIGLDGRCIIETSVNSSSINVISTYDMADDDLEIVHMTREFLAAAIRDGGVCSRWITGKVDLAGDCFIHDNCRPTLYDDNLQDLEQYYSDNGLQTYNQVIFVGYFPSNCPRYTICVTMDNEGGTLPSKSISRTVNRLAEYLTKY